MSKGNSGLFHGTLGSSLQNGSQDSSTYGDRNIEIPNRIAAYISKLRNSGDYIEGKNNEFSMKDASIMSKETGVEFARVTIGNVSYLIRGDNRGVHLPPKLLRKIINKSGRLDFHSHPFDDDCLPSRSDLQMLRFLRKQVGQESSMIVTPNGKTVNYNESGVISTGIVSNFIDKEYRKILLELFGGKDHD